MAKQLRSTFAFLAAWMFVFSMLSNCYCAPVMVEPSTQPMKSHCEHDTDNSKSKDSDCAPRFQTDNFEQTIVKTQPAHAVAISFSKSQILSKELSAQSLSRSIDPATFSSPPIYILVRSLLI